MGSQLYADFAIDRITLRGSEDTASDNGYAFAKREDAVDSRADPGVIKLPVTFSFWSRIDKLYFLYSVLFHFGASCCSS